MIREQEAERLERDSRAEVEREPRRDIPQGYFLMIIDEKIGLSVHVGDEEGEDNVDGEEGVDDVVDDEHGVLLVRQECELEGGDPRRVDDEEDQKHLPRPISRAEGRYDVLPEPRRLVDPSSQGRDEVTGEEAAVRSRARLKILDAEAS